MEATEALGGCLEEAKQRTKPWKLPYKKQQRYRKLFFVDLIITSLYCKNGRGVIQIPSIPILVSVLFPSLHLRIKFLLLVCIVFMRMRTKPHPHPVIS